MGSRTDPETRQASLLLSGLVLTPDDALETFRESRAADKELDVAHLKRARDLLDYLSAAINATDSEPWARIEQAWSLLQRNEAPRASPPRRPPPPRPRAPTPPVFEPTEALDMDALKQQASKRDEDDDELEGTMPVDRAIQRGGLPFKEGAAELPPPLSSADGARDMLGNTAYLDPREPRDIQTLPFDTKPADGGEEITTLHARPSPSSPGEVEAEPEPSGAYEPTERLDARAHALPISELPEHLRELTLEQHAALAAECSVYPQWKDQIHARYSVESNAERDLVDRHFQNLMDANPDLARQWRWHYQRYENWARRR